MPKRHEEAFSQAPEKMPRRKWVFALCLALVSMVGLGMLGRDNPDLLVDTRLDSTTVTTTQMQSTIQEVRRGGLDDAGRGMPCWSHVRRA